jgi:hypothetical protein
VNILSTYANRPDLNWFQKLSFIIDDGIRQNQHARALYRWGFFLPTKVRFVLDQMWVNFGVLPLFFLLLCWEISRFIFPNRNWHTQVTVLTLFTATIIATEVFLPYFGWGLLLMFCEFFFGFWFLDLMQNYDNALRREIADHK